MRCWNLASFCVSTDLHSDCLISDTCVRPYKNLHLPFRSPFGRLAMQKIKNGGCLISRLPKTIYVFNTSEPTTHKPTRPCYIFLEAMGLLWLNLRLTQDSFIFICSGVQTGRQAVIIISQDCACCRQESTQMKE